MEREAREYAILKAHHEFFNGMKEKKLFGVEKFRQLFRKVRERVQYRVK
jgi:hypothetical protein